MIFKVRKWAADIRRGGAKFLKAIDLQDCTAVAGLTLVFHGLYMWHVAVAYVVLGLILCVFSYATAGGAEAKKQ